MKKFSLVYSISLLFTSVIIFAKETPNEISNHPINLQTNHQNLAKSNLIYLNEERLEKTKRLIGKKDPFFSEHTSFIVTKM